MPYAIRKDGDKWKVINRITGHVFGTHPSHEHAMKQIEALHANVVEKSGFTFNLPGLVWDGRTLRKGQIGIDFNGPEKKQVGATKTEKGKEYILKPEKRHDAPRWHRIEAKHVAGGNIFHAKAEDEKGREAHFIAERKSEGIWHHQPDKDLPPKKIEDAEIVKELEAQHKEHNKPQEEKSDSKKMIMPIKQGTPIGTLRYEEDEDQDETPIDVDLRYGAETLKEPQAEPEPELTEEEEKEVATSDGGKSKEERAEARREFHRQKLEKQRARQKEEQDEIKRQMNDPEYAPKYVNGKLVKPKDEPLVSKEASEAEKEKQGTLFGEEKVKEEKPIDVPRDEAFDAMKIKLLRDILTTNPKSFTDIVKLSQTEKKGTKKKFEEISEQKKALIAEALQELHKLGYLWDGYEEPFKKHMNVKDLHEKNQRYAISPEGAKAITGKTEVLKKSFSWAIWRIFNKSKMAELLAYIDLHENNILEKAKRSGKNVKPVEEKSVWANDKEAEKKVMKLINEAVSKKIGESQNASVQ